MKYLNKKSVLLIISLCYMASGLVLNAQSYVRYIKSSDIGTKAIYADEVLPSVQLPKGVSDLKNFYKFNEAAYELYQVLENPDIEIMQVWVCGSASPDGLWGDNEKLSKARTDNAVNYIKSVMNIPDYLIHAESLVEDWDRLAEMVEASDLPYKYEILYIIRTKTWGERKTALQKLDGGSIWKILEKDFFPKLRCVRFAIFCKWDPSKPYMSDPSKVSVSLPVSEPAVVEPAPAVLPSPVPPTFSSAEVVVETPVKVDTVYVRDTVVYHKETVIVEKPLQAEQVRPVDEYKQKTERKIYDTPWMMGVKTNLIADAMAIPMLGMEFQIGKRVSLDLQGWYTNKNIFCKEDNNTNVYGFTPELRIWTDGNTMQRGSFFGVHARTVWYTMRWTDGYLYQNGSESQYSGNAGSTTPAWSIGLTYGYSLALDRKAHWGIEFLVGIGYGKYSQNLGAWNATDGKWYIHEHQNGTHIGITRAGINLTYRFSARRVKPEYYENR